VTNAIGSGWYGFYLERSCFALGADDEKMSDAGACIFTGLFPSIYANSAGSDPIPNLFIDVTVKEKCRLVIQCFFPVPVGRCYKIFSSHIPSLLVYK
jgi:hypothetical protein